MRYLERSDFHTLNLRTMLLEHKGWGHLLQPPSTCHLLHLLRICKRWTFSFFLRCHLLHMNVTFYIWVSPLHISVTFDILAILKSVSLNPRWPRIAPKWLVLSITFEPLRMKIFQWNFVSIFQTTNSRPSKKSFLKKGRIVRFRWKTINERIKVAITNCKVIAPQ